MDKINERVISEALYLTENFCTIREVARVFKVSKSTVHNDLSIRLKKIDKDLYLRIKDIFIYNINVRHIRGGEATKKMYEMKKSINSINAF